MFSVVFMFHEINAFYVYSIIDYINSEKRVSGRKYTILQNRDTTSSFVTAFCTNNANG